MADPVACVDVEDLVDENEGGLVQVKRDSEVSNLAAEDGNDGGDDEDQLVGGHADDALDRCHQGVVSELSVEWDLLEALGHHNQCDEEGALAASRKTGDASGRDHGGRRADEKSLDEAFKLEVRAAIARCCCFNDQAGHDEYGGEVE